MSEKGRKEDGVRLLGCVVKAVHTVRVGFTTRPLVLEIWHLKPPLLIMVELSHLSS